MPSYRCILFLLLSSPIVSAENWPQFRGPGGSGVSETATPPTKWSETDNIAWIATIPGRAWSSPIVWGSTLFVTSAVSVDGAFKEPSTGIYGNDYAAELAERGLSDEEVMERIITRDIELASETEAIRYMLYALDAESGEVLWEREAHRGKPFGGRHRKNTYASETPATDGERVYAYFGNVGLYCYSMKGELIWKKQWEPQKIYLDFGTASSPIVADERVYIQHDTQEESFLAAVDKKTGEEIFRVARGGGKSMISSGWSTPFVWRTKEREEVVSVGHGVAIGYDNHGKELWRLLGLSGQATPTPLAGANLLFLSTGSQGESNRPVYAVRPGASGDISLSEGETHNAFVAWKHPRASAYTSSPLLYRGRLYIVNDNGILSVLDAKSGERLYRARVGGGGHTFSASPWAYGGNVFFLSEDGDTFVARAGIDVTEHEEIAKNSLGEMSFASPAIGEDSLYLRTQTKLYRISEATNAP